MPKKIFLQLFLCCLAVAFLSLAVAGWHLVGSVRASYQAQRTANLETKIDFLAARTAALVERRDAPAIQELCREMGGAAGVRLTVIAPDGTVLGDTLEEPGRMDNHRERPEIAAALRGSRGSSIRFSATMDERYLYVALPLRRENRIVGALRAAVSIASMDRALATINRQILGTGLVVVLLAAGLSLLVARRIARPIQVLRTACANFAAGRLDDRLRLNTGGELDELASNVDRLAESLRQRLAQITAQNRELEAILASMTEGVVALDQQGRVLNANLAAQDLLGHPPAWKGLGFREVVRIPELQQFIADLLAGATADTEREFAVHDRERRQFQVLGAPLGDAEGNRLGALIVLNDVTRLRRLENVRRDFVDNVSHEIKTPLTAIKGAVEALLDGAPKPQADRERFLAIVGKHTDRLCSIIDDILSLSRIEQTADTIPLTEAELAPALATALDFCREKADAKGVALRLTCPRELRAAINGPLLEQAVMNLIDNAITYSEKGDQVDIAAEAAAGGAVIRVRDRGCGIPAENLPRLFERFYRVDKARSRKLGGTGLGLAIVKHIVQVHKGQVEVASAVGEGSTFSIILPRPETTPAAVNAVPPTASPAPADAGPGCLPPGR